MNLKVLLAFAIVSALILPIAASGQVESQELDQSQSSNWDDREELKLLRVIGGPDSELFSEPTDIAVGESGNIYVADYGNKRIQILNPLGQLVQTIELKGSPHGITLDKNENIYVTEWWDFIGIEKFTKTGEPATDFQIEDQSVFGLPSDIVIDPDGILYVLEHRNLDIDYGENAGVHKIDTDGSYIEFIPIPETAITDKSKFSLMVMDHEGWLYIVDQSGDNIILLDSTNGNGRPLALIYFQTPTSIAINPDGYFFISDQRYENNKRSIHIFDEYYLPIRTIGDAGKEEGKIWGIHGLEFDKDGNMYLLDFEQNKIQVFHIAPKVFGPLFYEETEKVTPVAPSYSPSGDDLVAVLNTGSGQIVIEFFDEDAPKHVENFIALAENDWYETTLFHRIIKDFMIQGGDPNTKPVPGNTSDKWGTGDPGYSIDAEFNSIKHERGIVSMARSSDPNSAGSQFFIVHKDSTHLDEQYTVFGRLITSESYEILDKIANLQVNSRNQPYEGAMQQAVLFDVKIVSRSSIENVLTMDPPNRILGFTPDHKYIDEELNFSVTSPVGWGIIKPAKFDDNSPIYLASGPSKDGVKPQIYMNSKQLGEDGFKDFIDKRITTFHKLHDEGKLDLETENLTEFMGGHAYVVTLKQYINKDLVGNEPYQAQLKQFIFATSTTVYGITYVNLESNYPDHLDLLNEFRYSFLVEGETMQTLGGVVIGDSNFDGKYYNNEEKQFRFEVPYRWEPLTVKTGVGDDGVGYYRLSLEPNALHVNYFKDGVQARYMINIYETTDHAFTEHTTQMKNIYHGYENEGKLSLADEYMGMTADGHPVYFVEYLEPYYIAEDEYIPIHTREVTFANADFLYKITYTNHENNFTREISSYNYLLENFKFNFDGKMKSVDWGPNIIKYNPVDDRDPSERGGGCLIATAAFGSEMSPQVQFLREIRDNTVLQTESGTLFMAGFNQFYYSFSPIIADYERENPVFKEAVKLTLTPLLTSLTLLQYTSIDSESEMLGYGIGIILLNIGMYFVAPAVLIMKIRTSYNKIPKNI